MRKRAQVRYSSLDRRIRLHDRQQFELKLEYHPPPGDNVSRYLVESYVWAPASLNVTPETVPPTDLYLDVHNYVRLKTPELSFAELVALPASPLARAAEEAHLVAEGADPVKFIYEVKLLGCVFRAALRDLSSNVERAIRMGPIDEEAMKLTIDATLAGAASVAAAYRKLGETVVSPSFPESALAAFRLADEYISLSIEQAARRAIVLLDGTNGDTVALKARLLDAILAEDQTRRERGYPSVLDPASDNETYLYRIGLLKKYCSSVLFLQIRRMGTRKRWQELFYAIAAGIAMTFAVVVALWAQGLPRARDAALILIIAYMFKDRLKESARGFFARFLDRFLFDRNTEIDHPAGGTLGRCREKIEYVAPERIPAAVAALRRKGADPTARVAEEALKESVYHYKKEIVLDAFRLRQRRGGAGITDIVRFHIGRLLHEMDEPIQTIEWVDQDTGKIGPLRGAKVYHVDVVFRFTSRKGEPPTTTLMRLILDRRGIKRIERYD